MGEPSDQGEPLARVAVSAIRYWVTIVATAALAVMMVRVSALTGSLTLQALFLAAAVGAAVLVATFWRRGRNGLTLTDRMLIDDTGHIVCTWDNIASVNRTFSILRPAKGFLIELKEEVDPRGWHPGVWWRLGPRIGVGGMVPGRQAQMMADIITLRLKIADGSLETP